jgi:hypothetical protein
MIRLTDGQWERIRNHFPEENIADGRPGRKPVSTRRVLEAVLWILNTGAQWLTHILCCSCGMYFSAAASSENDQGSMNLASNTEVKNEIAQKPSFRTLAKAQAALALGLLTFICIRSTVVSRVNISVTGRTWFQKADRLFANHGRSYW